MPISNLIAPAFYPLHNDIKNSLHTHYRLCGGRGSTKSSFISIEIILGMMKDKNANALALRKVGAYVKDSVFMQLKWAIEMLGLKEFWEIKQSVPELILKDTGQRILFRGADNPQKIKSTKVSKGYIKFIWFEELSEFSGMKEIRSINQSLMRGGEDFKVFYSYNPPISQRNWVNSEEMKLSPDTIIHKSTYLDVPKSWLGKQFILEAEHLRDTNKALYEHEYLGRVVGTGSEVFKNLNIRKIEDYEIQAFDNIKCGVDFGYAADPFVFLQCHYRKNKLYIFDEVYACGMSNAMAAKEILKRKISNSLIVCDSAEPKSIRDLRDYGLRVIGAKKGPDSIEYGIKFLQSLDEIVIDKDRCKNTAREFLNYELLRDTNGNLRSDYPDKDNHTIDAARYALESETSTKRAKVISRKELGI